jgi:alpha-ribazole phosphatase
MELILIRHPRATVAPDSCVGHLDVDCAAGWEGHADRLQKMLAAPDRLIASPLRRCSGIAARLGAAWRVAPEFDPRLMELNFGEWEGRRWSEIDRRDHDLWPAGQLDSAPPGGESYNELLARIDAFRADLGTSFERIALVTHAGPVRALLTRCLGLAPEAGWRFEIGYGRVSRLAEHGGAWRLEVLNA